MNLLIFCWMSLNEEIDSSSVRSINLQVFFSGLLVTRFYPINSKLVILEIYLQTGAGENVMLL